VSFFRPHQCYTPAQRFWDLYDDDLDPPPGLLDDAAYRPPHFRAMVEQYRSGQGQYEPRDFESWARRVWRGYLAAITHCDHALGVLLDHLDQRGLADRTIVVYHSDHGAYSGTFGVPEKAPGICSDAVCRVPMLWRVPGLTPAGHVCDQLVENIDLAPTFQALAGLDPMGTEDGHDLGPLLAGGDEPVRDVAVTENAWSKAIRWDRWRMTHYQPQMFDQPHGELYDLQADPHERRNLFTSPDQRDVVERGRALLLQWLIGTTRARTLMMAERDGDPNPTQMLAGDGKRHNDFDAAEAHRRGTLNYL
jgi:arylsulfatase A-like enzyme